MAKLDLTVLEGRDVPSAATLTNGVLSIQGDARAENVITLDPVTNPGDVRVTLNGARTNFSGVTSIVVVGGDKADDISNNTSIAWTVLAGKGDDTILGGGVNDVYDAGPGKDVVYDLLGTNVINSNDGQEDKVFTNAASTVYSDGKDSVVYFFATGRGPGAGAISLENGVLYIAPTNAGTSVSVDEVGKNVVVTYNFGTGTQTFTAATKDVQWIAYFGGSGNDTYVNNTDISEAAYGSAGNDTIIGGLGDFSLLKGSGGNDTLQGRAKRNDISGNGGADTLILGPKDNTVRYDALDILVGVDKRDLLVLS